METVHVDVGVIFDAECDCEGRCMSCHLGIFCSHELFVPFLLLRRLIAADIRHGHFLEILSPSGISSENLWESVYWRLPLSYKRCVDWNVHIIHRNSLKQAWVPVWILFSTQTKMSTMPGEWGVFMVQTQEDMSVWTEPVELVGNTECIWENCLALPERWSNCRHLKKLLGTIAVNRRHWVVKSLFFRLAEHCYHSRHRVGQCISRLRLLIVGFSSLYWKLWHESEADAMET